MVIDDADDLDLAGLAGAMRLAAVAVSPVAGAIELGQLEGVDVQQRTVRTLSGLTGSALFPSWTEDGRLCFRYDGPDYRGFMMASRVLDVAPVPLLNPKMPVYPVPAVTFTALIARLVPVLSRPKIPMPAAPVTDPVVVMDNAPLSVFCP